MFHVLTRNLPAGLGRRAGLIAAAAAATVAGVTGLAGSAPQAAATPSQAASPVRYGVVTAGGGLTARVAASVHSSAVSSYRHGARVSIDCKVHGSDVGGNTLWYGLVHGDQRFWVSARYVSNDGPAPDFCNPSDGFFRGRTTATLNQRSGPSTADRVVARYRFDDRVDVACFLGPARNRWFYTDWGRWVNARWVLVDPDVPFCSDH